MPLIPKSIAKKYVVFLFLFASCNGLGQSNCTTEPEHLVANLYLWAIDKGDKELTERISQNNSGLVDRIKANPVKYYNDASQRLALEGFEAGKSDLFEIIYPFSSDANGTTRKLNQKYIDGVKVSLYAAACHMPRTWKEVDKDGTIVPSAAPLEANLFKKDKRINSLTMAVMTVRLDRAPVDRERLKCETIRNIMVDHTYLIRSTIDYLIAPDSDISKIDLPRLPTFIKLLNRKEALDCLAKALACFQLSNNLIKYIVRMLPYVIKSNGLDKFYPLFRLVRPHIERDPSYAKYMVRMLSYAIEYNHLDLLNDLFRLVSPHIAKDPSYIKDIVGMLPYAKYNDLDLFHEALTLVQSHIEKDPSYAKYIVRMLSYPIAYNRSDLLNDLFRLVSPHIAKNPSYVKYIVGMLSCAISHNDLDLFHEIFTSVQPYIEKDPSYAKLLRDLYVLAAEKGNQDIISLLKPFLPTLPVLEENERCAICLSGLTNEDNLSLFVCDHFFHEECIKSCKYNNNWQCPLCRGKLECKLPVVKYSELIQAANRKRKNPDSEHTESNKRTEY